MSSAVLALAAWAIGLIAAGCVLVAGALAALVTVLCLKKRRESNLSMEYLLKLGEKEKSAEPAPAEQPADAAAPEETKKIVTSLFGFRTFLYNKSFTAKLIQLDDIPKEWYSMLKNELLSYKKVRDRMSWKHESFRIGRKCVARFSIRGKSLRLQLNADAAQYAGTKYRVEDVSHVKSNADVPCLYRIKTSRKAQYAKELIADVMTRTGAVKTERKAEDYVLPYEETEELIGRGLIKKIEVVIPVKEGDEELNTFVEDEATAAALGIESAATPYAEDDIDLLFDDEFGEEDPADEEEEPENVAEPEEAAEPAVKAAPAEEPEREIAVSYDEYIEEDFDDEEEEPEEETEVETIEEEEEAEEASAPETPTPAEKVRYDKSFTAKVIQLSNTSKRWYSKLKNEILSYAKTCDVMSWKRESFRLNDDYVVRFIVRGKTLCLLLALDPVKYSEAKYRVQDVSKRHACEDTPCMMRLKNERSVKNAVHLIAEAMKKAGAKKSARYTEKDYYIPYKTTSQLIEQGLVRSSK